MPTNPNEAIAIFADQCVILFDQTVRTFDAGFSMAQKQRDHYLSLRRELEPTGVTLVIRGDLPPASGKYF